MGIGKQLALATTSIVILGLLSLGNVANAATEKIFSEYFDEDSPLGWNQSLCNLSSPLNQVCRIGTAPQLLDAFEPAPTMAQWGFVEIESNGGGGIGIPVEVRYQKSFNVAIEDDYDVSAWLGIKDCNLCSISTRLYIDGVLVLERVGPNLPDNTPNPPPHNFFEQSIVHLTTGSHTIELGMYSDGALTGNFRASFDSVVIQRDFTPAINYQEPIPIPNSSGGMAFEGNILAIGNELYDIQGNLIRSFENPNLPPGSRWGFSVDIDKNLILIGTPFDGGANPIIGGSAFLFDVNTGELLHSFYPSEPKNELNFGFSVALSENKAIVTTVGKIGIGANPPTGPTHVYDVTTGSLLYTINSPIGNNSHFGWCIDADGDNAIIAQARGLYFGSGPGPAAYLFDLTDGSLLQSYFPPDATSVSISNDKLLFTKGIGSIFSPPEDYLYDTSGNLLDSFPKYPYIPTINPCRSNDIEEELILSGSPGDVIGDFVQAGSVRLLDTSGNLLNTFLNPDPENFEEFGKGLKLSNSNVLIGTGAEGSDSFYLYIKDGNSVLTVKSEDRYGNPITGYYTLLKQNGITLDTDYTPANFQLYNGDTYLVGVRGYGNFKFDHWKDTGSTVRDRDIAIASDTELIAVYRDITIPLTIPSPPLELTATLIYPRQINLAWEEPSNDGGTDIIGYKIEKKAESGPWETLIENAGTGTSYSDLGLLLDTTYTYRVSAINSIGTSTPSNEASETTPPLIPLPPPNSLVEYSCSGPEIANTDPGQVPFASQTLVATSDNLVAVDLFLIVHQVPSYLTVEIVNEGVTVGSVTKIFTDLVSVNELDPPVRFLFDSPVELTEGTEYIIKATTEPFSNSIAWTGTYELDCIPGEGNHADSYLSPPADYMLITYVQESLNEFPELTVHTLYGSTEITGYYTVLSQGGVIQDTGFSPTSFILNNGEAYNVGVQNYGNFRFDHWQDTDSTVANRDITIIDDTELFAVYRNINDPLPGTSEISIQTVNSSGDEISGYWTVFLKDGVILQTGFSPETFGVNNGETYQVLVGNYGGVTFDHWEDGSTDNPRTFSLTSDQTFTAYYLP